MNIAKNILLKKSSLFFIAFFLLSFCYVGDHIFSPFPFTAVAEAATIAEAQEAEESFLGDEDEEEEEEEEEEEGEEAPVEIPAGFEEFPEFRSNPDNPNRDMIRREDFVDLPPAKISIFGLSNRYAVWALAQLHILFASFILGVPMYILICEILSCYTGDARYQRLAREVTKVIIMCYSFTALTGGALLLILVTAYPTFITWLFRGFSNLITFWYPMLFLAETVLMYLYYYLWDPLYDADKKWAHISIGVLLNVVSILLLLALGGLTSFMTTPPKVDGSIRGIATFGQWAWFYNPSFWGLNWHRIFGNLTFGGYLVAFIAAFKFIFAKTDEERAYYDWQGYTGNTLGVGFLLPLPLMGYYLARELYAYDAAIGMYIMSDRLSMYMETQAILVGFLFIGSSYYIWVSLQRVEGAEKYLRWVKINFAIMFVCSALWFTPRHIFATMVPEPGMIPEGMDKAEYMKVMELSGNLAFMGVMAIKIKGAFGLVFMTFVNYVLYRIAIKRGKIVWGKINPVSQLILIFLAFSGIWLMGLMGSIRSLARRNYHVYRVFKDMTPEAFTPSLKDGTLMITAISLVYFAILAGVVWLQLGTKSAPKKVTSEQPVTPGLAEKA